MALKNHSLDQNVSRETYDSPFAGLLATLTDKQLLALREAIEEKLGIGTLESLDIGKELVIQFIKLKALQQDALDDVASPHGQRAAAASTVSRMLQDLTKCRVVLNNAEISKKIDAMVIECMHEAPIEAKDAFFAHYERLMASLPKLATLMPEADKLPLETPE